MSLKNFAPAVAIALVALAFAPASTADGSVIGEGQIVSPAPNGTLARTQSVVLSYQPGAGSTNVSGEVRLDGILIGSYFRSFTNGTNETVFSVDVEVPANVTSGTRLLAATFRQGALPSTDSHYVEYVGGPANTPPTLFIESASYQTGVGFRIGGRASDAESHVASITISSPYQSVTIQRPNGTWNATLGAIPDRLGVHNLSVVARDAEGLETRHEIGVVVQGTPVVLYDERGNLPLGTHADAFRLPLPARLLEGKVAIECVECGVAVGGVHVEIDADTDSTCSRYHAGLPWVLVGNCSFTTRSGPGSATIAWAQANADLRLTISAVAV